MINSLLLIALGIFILYLLLDFFIQGADINKYGQKWLTKALWLWLPFYGLWRLTKEVFFKK